MIDALDEQARQILTTNDRGTYTVPTDGLYPYQWNWDSAFAAFGFASFDIDRAWLELHTLFSGQWDNGMVPHIIFHQVDEGYFPGPDVWGTNKTPLSSGISQPPVAATFMRKIYETNPTTGRENAPKLFDKLVDWHRWFHINRCETGAAVITHPWEAGRDNAPDWDDAMAAIDVSNVKPYKRRDTSHVDPHMRPTKYDYDRYIALVDFARENDWDQDIIRRDSPFRVADPTMTFILLRANRDLKWLAEQLGKDSAEIESWISHLEKGTETLWNEELGAYDSIDLRSGKFANSLSCASFLCWYGGVSKPQMLSQLDIIFDEAKYSVPSYSPSGSQFDPKRYWRGPVWGVVNTLIGMGLEDMGYKKQAERVRQDTATLIEKNGFAEYYDPFDGTAAGGGTFTWTAAIWLSWASPNAKKPQTTEHNNG